ncbi:hypothetical protein SLA2020_113720 [Shorea laevis]
MADVEMMSSDSESIDGDSYDFRSLLSSLEIDFLIRNNGDQVKIDSLEGKKLGFYFSDKEDEICQIFTQKLVDVYKELSSKGDFEIIFASWDYSDDTFEEFFSEMPWLAIPFLLFYLEETLDELDDFFFQERDVPRLVILDEHGKVVTDDGVSLIQKYGVDGYPFSAERFKELKEEEEKARREQTIRSILASPSSSRDFVISSDGNKVPVSKLEGKTVGLYFSLSSCKSCVDFTPKLVEVYKKLEEKGESFEIVLISLDDEEKSFKESFGGMPWLALPFKDKSCENLARYFELSTTPTVVIIGPDGKTLQSNVAEDIEEHGIQAYPFTPQKFAELAEMEKAKEMVQTLESILVSGDLDFVIGKDGVRIPVSDLVGKNILLYFSAHHCLECHHFLPKLIESYHEIKAKDEPLEVVFISSDNDQASFDKSFSEMPWLALPFGDARKSSLSRRFKVIGIPMLVAIGSSGRTVTKEAKDLITMYRAKAYPFTEERLKEVEAEYEEMAKEWPEKVKYRWDKKRELTLMHMMHYRCDECNEYGQVWAYRCKEYDIKLHPKCALEAEAKGTESESESMDEETERWVCGGDMSIGFCSSSPLSRGRQISVLFGI